jgi:N-acetylglucosaminyldiphosphoundecaprenol N-acetyl-beta-D-mannosaminyltransferase
MAYLRLCDSAIIFRLLAIKGTPLPARLTGSDLTPELLQIAETEGWRVFLFGSDVPTLERVQKRYPRVICGAASPPIHDRPWDLEDLNKSYLLQIKAANPDLLFVALGVKKQEYWTRKYFAQTEVPVTICVGASLDFIGGRIYRAPQFVSKIGLEWLWRLLLEPRRLWRRYSGDTLFLVRHGIGEIMNWRRNNVAASTSSHSDPISAFNLNNSDVTE